MILLLSRRRIVVGIVYGLSDLRIVGIRLFGGQVRVRNRRRIERVRLVLQVAWCRMSSLLCVEDLSWLSLSRRGLYLLIDVPFEDYPLLATSTAAEDTAHAAADKEEADDDAASNDEALGDLA